MPRACEIENTQRYCKLKHAIFKHYMLIYQDMIMLICTEYLYKFREQSSSDFRALRSTLVMPFVWRFGECPNPDFKFMFIMFSVHYILLKLSIVYRISCRTCVNYFYTGSGVMRPNEGLEAIRGFLKPRPGVDAYWRSQ
jgi:hypothetical protein